MLFHVLDILCLRKEIDEGNLNSKASSDLLNELINPRKLGAVDALLMRIRSLVNRTKT